MLPASCWLAHDAFLMSRIQTFLLTFIPLAAMLIGLPLLGVWLAGKPLDSYFEFPPQTRFVQPAPFSWTAFCFYSALIAAALAALVHRAVRSYRAMPTRTPTRLLPLPWWGWTAGILGTVAWILAWTRLAWFAAFQPHTFTPLWLAYIAMVNALSFRRTGRSLLTDRPLFFGILFPASALFWWCFEYLNRFVQNWYYTGVRFGPWEYFWYATLPFATVLPAVLSTQELIRSSDRIQRAFGRVPPVPFSNRLLWSWLLLAAAAGGLAVIGIWPNYFFSLVWVAPLLILVALRNLQREPHPLQRFTRTDWTSPASAMLATLVCGFFWEMWNTFSLAQWRYSIPFVHRFEIFAMPLLGYAGYFPFGLECAAVADLLEGLFRKEGSRPETV
jgi:hypothetical protein